jgi:predicted dehydrogenase
MEIYGLTGAILVDNGKQLRLRMAEGYDGFSEEKFEMMQREQPFDDPFSMLKAVVRGEVTLPPFDLSGLENNLIVMEILEAAKESAKTGKTVRLGDL